LSGTLATLVRMRNGYRNVGGRFECDFCPKVSTFCPYVQTEKASVYGCLYIVNIELTFERMTGVVP